MTKRKLPVRVTGQHFTVDKVLIEDAIKQSNITHQDTVLDIGAGKGFLTAHLLHNAHKVIALENDFALSRYLQKKFVNAQNVEVVGCDFRNFIVPDLLFKVVSNIPYGITSEILKRLMFENIENFGGGSIILQLEAAQKLFSNSIYNPIIVLYRTFYDLKLLYRINPHSFLPPPTVNSALLRIERKEKSLESKLKLNYFSFVSYVLKNPDLPVNTALKSVFRKKQVRAISEKLGIQLDLKIVRLSPNQWQGCFLEMLEVVPEKFHPS